MSTVIDNDCTTEPTILNRRLFAGGLLAGLAAAGMAFPAAAQGLKDVDDEDPDDRDDETGEIPEEWEELGVTSEYSYESPQFGHTVEWEEPWMLDPDDPAMSDVPMEMDEITLLWEPGEHLEVGLAVLGIPAEPSGITSLGDFLMGPEGQKVWFGDKFETEEYLVNTDVSSFEILFALNFPDDGSFSSWVFLLGTEVTSDVWVLSTLVSNDELLEDTFNGFSEKVFVNGENLVRLTTWRDIERAIR
jgi:hypothetical protein